MKKVLLFACMATLLVSQTKTWDSSKSSVVAVGLLALAARPVMKALSKKKMAVKSEGETESSVGVELYSPGSLVRTVFNGTDHEDNTKTEFTVCGLRVKMTYLNIADVLQNLGILGASFQVKRATDPAANPEMVEAVRSNAQTADQKDVWAINCQGNVGPVGLQMRIPLSDMLTSIAVMLATWGGQALLQSIQSQK